MDAVIEVFNELGESLGITVTQIAIANFIPALIVLVIGLIGIKFVMRWVIKVLEKSKIEKSLHTFIKSAIKFILGFVVLVIILGMLGIPVTTLVATLSVAGLAVSLAVQGSLTNLAGGVSILATKPFKVGDFIEACEMSGTVKEIGLFYTALDTSDKRLVYIPNGKISDDTVINYNVESERKLTLKFRASYEDDIDKVKKALKEAVDSDKRILKKPEALINVSAYLDSSIEYIVAVWVKRTDYWDVNWYLLEEVKHSFDRNGVKMSYNHINVHMS